MTEIIAVPSPPFLRDRSLSDFQGNVNPSTQSIAAPSSSSSRKNSDHSSIHLPTDPQCSIITSLLHKMAEVDESLETIRETLVNLDALHRSIPCPKEELQSISILARERVHAIQQELEELENATKTCPKPERSIVARQLSILVRKATAMVEEFRSLEVRANLRDPNRGATSCTLRNLGSTHLPETRSPMLSPTSSPGPTLTRHLSWNLPATDATGEPTTRPLAAPASPSAGVILITASDADPVDDLNETVLALANQARKAELLRMEALRREPSRDTTVTVQISKVIQQNRARQIRKFIIIALILAVLALVVVVIVISLQKKDLKRSS